jgi:hypothetical protein
MGGKDVLRYKFTSHKAWRHKGLKKWRQWNSCNHWGEGTCPNGPRFSFFWGKGGGARLLLFPLCSHHIPQHVSNSSSLYPIFFALSSTLENLHIQPKGGDYNASILRLFNALFYFIFIDGPIKDAQHNLDFIFIKLLFLGGSHN